MAWLDEPSQRDRFNLIVLSDHGQLTVREQFSVRQGLVDLGVSAGVGCFGAGEAAIIPGSFGSVHIRDHKPALIRKIGRLVPGATLVRLAIYPRHQ